MDEKKFIVEVKEIIIPLNGKITQFVEDKKEFGNVTLILNIDEKEYIFETDRGEILVNKKTIFSVFHDFKSYLSKYEKLLIAIKKTFNKV